MNPVRRRMRLITVLASFCAAGAFAALIEDAWAILHTLGVVFDGA